ncbi:MAG: cytochrome c [Chitinophagaceae bacterium]|jgi:mono/diheme cytochrome c family protein|nr:cytochrome c [Chitinophagaceae bacterium]
MKRIIYLSICIPAMGLLACGGGDSSSQSSAEAPQSMIETKDPGSYDPKRGEGKWNAENVKLEPSINIEIAKKGDEIQAVKCASCHKLSEEKLVGPGWKGVTSRRAPEWIMNFITNPDPMIEKDPEVQAQLEICLVRMPNQSLSDDEARNILEFMRKNDQ